MSKSQRESMLSELTSKIFSQMLNEVVMDSAIQSHQEIARSRAICEVCHIRCGNVHIPSISIMPATQVLQSSQASSPSSNVADSNNMTNGKSDGNIYLECIGCSRQIASSRYAPHLSSCLGFGTGVRRAVARISTQASKAKIAAQSQSPLRDITEDAAPEEPKPTKVKGRPKGSTNKRTEIETESSLAALPAIISKKQKLIAPPHASKKSDTDLLKQQTPGIHSVSQKLPTTTSAQGTAAISRASSTESGSSSDNPMASASTSTSSNVSMQSPSLPTSGSISRRKKDSKSVPTSTQKRLPSAIQSKHSPPPVTAVRRIPDIDYHIDVEGEETGSSSDTDT